MIASFTHGLARDLKDRQIRVNAVSPGVGKSPA
ncbi:MULTISPECIES: SDR family oxidoreductase [Nostocaceae]|nr:hypothetical protein [Anabaena sp. UHCC 0399]MEA5567474.1 hypothetical protein [Anabaena sp. UHCC 0399]